VARTVKASRTRGTKAEGRAYERKVAKHFVASLPQGTTHFIGPWIEYGDAGGYGFAQPDYVALTSAGIGLIVEAKRTRCADAREQLLRLYYPLCAHLFPAISSWVLIAASKFWAGSQDWPLVSSPADALRRAEAPLTVVDYHWKGRS
jgi:hypothetical protein